MPEKSAAPSDLRYPDAPIFKSAFLIGKNDTMICADAAMNESIRQAIAVAGGVVFLDVIAPDLLETLIETLTKAMFTQTDLEEYGLRGNDLSARASLPFCLALARPPFLRWLEKVGGTDPITNIEGHLVQMILGNNLGWHRDAGHGIRRLAMVLNLTTTSYEGGRFELRRKSPPTPMLAYQANTPGSLSIFRLGTDLQHQVTKITCGGPRTVFTGWARGPWVEADLNRGLPLAAWPPLIPDDPLTP